MSGTVLYPRCGVAICAMAKEGIQSGSLIQTHAWPGLLRRTIGGNLP